MLIPSALEEVSTKKKEVLEISEPLSSRECDSQVLRFERDETTNVSLNSQPMYLQF